MKKNIFKRIICVVLSLFTLSLCACKEDDNEVEVPKNAFVGTHDYTAPEINQWLVKDGKSDYVVVIPETRSTTIDKALAEFVWLFKKATGVALRTTTDRDTSHSETAKYISLGNTETLKSAGIEVDRNFLGVDGGRIVTKDSSVYIFGGEDKGTLYAVYTFMSICFDFEQYFKDCYEIKTGVTSVKLRQFAVTDIPDIAYRVTYEKFIFTDTSSDYDINNFASRMRMDTTMTEPMLPIYASYNTVTGTRAFYHNTSEYLPSATYGEAHPEWFSTEGNQLCYTARGDEEAREEMAQEIARKIENSMKLYTPDKYPLKNIVTFTLEDNNESCACEACRKSNQIYGGHAGALVQLVNRVGEIVEEWQAKEENSAYRREDLKIITFAYNATTIAPCKKNADGEWEAIDATVKMRKNVGLFLAPIQNIDYQSSIYADVNKAGKENIDAWGALTDSIYFWTYNTNFSYYCYMYDTLDFFNAEGYTYLASTGAKYLFNQPQTGQTGTSTAWHNLKLYLDSKLSWNCNLNTEELIDNYFNAMFRDAAPIMKRMFYTHRGWNAHLCEENNLYVVRSIYTKIEKRDYWPYEMLRDWMNQYEEAWETIEKYKTSDPELYKQLYYHIGSEWISPAYVVFKLYRSELSYEDDIALTAKFKDVVKTTGMGTVAEHNAGSMQTFAEDL